MKSTIVTVLGALLLVIAIGCSTMSKDLTPARIDGKAVSYSVKAEAADANEFRGYGNLSKAERLAEAVDQANILNVFQLQHLADKNQLDYTMIKGTVTKNVKVAEQRENALFGETGLLSVGLSALGAGGLAGGLSLFRKKQAVAAAVAETEAAGAKTEAALTETVKGVQTFLNEAKTTPVATLLEGYKDGNIGDVLKDFLRAKQSPTTKQTVATIKAAT